VSKVGHYLQEHLLGEVVAATDVRRHFSTDASIFTQTPSLVVYPQNENDVRKVARFSWQLAERSRTVPITARGAGTDQSGAAIGSGISMVFPAHMNRIVELDGKTGNVVVEPGIIYGKLQQTLMTHGRFLPPAPASLEYSTVGGAVANNASSDRSLKYGSTRQYVKSLRAVLANGEVIVTNRLSKRELSKKLGLATFEGEIYRGIDALIEEHHKTIEQMDLTVTKNAAGYNLLDVKRSDGSIDLTPLLVGSQGTLALTTEITLSTELHNPETTLLVADFDSVQNLAIAALELRNLDEQPSAIELVDKHLIEQIHLRQPNLLKDQLKPPYPNFILLVEFDNADRQRKRGAKHAAKILEKYAAAYDTETDPAKQHELWKIRQLSGMLAAHNEGAKRAVPIIDDGAVPPEKLAEYIKGIYSLLAKHRVEAAVWGHVGDGNLHMMPSLDIGQIGDRQKAFKLLDDYCRLVTSLGGTISAEYGDGRVRAPYLRAQYGNEVYALLQKVKSIFDPYNILNPGVKIDVSLDDIKPLIRSEQSLGHLYDHLPRS
jgi:FAD/FMN-containing dehydrogenase